MLRRSVAFARRSAPARHVTETATATIELYPHKNLVYGYTTTTLAVTAVSPGENAILRGNLT